jgi:hypothetical protein
VQKAQYPDISKVVELQAYSIFINYYLKEVIPPIDNPIKKIGKLLIDRSW